MKQRQTCPHVLVAEDDARMRHLLARTLRRAGFAVTETCDGSELLEAIGDQFLRADGGFDIDLVITDVRMPILSGMSVLTALRWEGIPVIVITGFGDAETHATAERLGAVTVFDKPFDLGELRAAALRYALRA